MSNNGQIECQEIKCQEIKCQEYATASGHIVGHARLNAPASLNALTLEMIDALFRQLTMWQEDKRVVAVILDGQGEKAFCAGGDIRKLHTLVLESKGEVNSFGEQFFSHEYRLDYLIHTYGKPVLCWGAGIVMGGGIGLMAGASHRIVTLSSKLAMPEIAIGLFPDVGGSWILGRMPGRTGLFLGLTGTRLNASDALFCGLADRFLGDGTLPDIISAMQTRHWLGNGEEDCHVLDNLLRQAEREQAIDAPVSAIRENFDLIQQVTDAERPEQILEAIRAQEGEWWQRAATSLAKGCPVTAAIVGEQLRRARHLSLADVFRMELNIAVRCLNSPNFAEGVRALLLERGSQAMWQPASMADISCDLVREYFISPWPEDCHPLADM